MESLARVFIIVGLIIMIVGGLLLLGARTGIFSHLPLGRLPGDIHIQNGNFSFYFPLASSILISILLTIVLNIVVRLIRK